MLSAEFSLLLWW